MRFFLFCDAALQLHPDKNRHPKAEVAFKIVSEVMLAPFLNSSCIGSGRVLFSQSS
jgi:hypothetical protein